MAKRIVLIDDEDDILELLSVNLEKESFRVNYTNNSLKALDLVNETKPDIVFLDIMMPEKDGYEVCKDIRKIKDIEQPHIIFLTAKSEEIDEIIGLEIGADDYIQKPFSPRKVVAKAKAVSRHLDRKQLDEKKSNEKINVDGIEVDRISYTVKVDGEEVTFLHKEFELLFFLMKRPGIAFSRSELLDHVWGEDSYFVERTIDVHITKIRKKIKPYDKRIKTISGIGYKFVK